MSERHNPIPGPDVVRLLHLEDNRADALLMQEYVRGVLPQAQFDEAARLSDLTAERAAAADCALVDLSLPDATGIDALLTLRQMSETIPIIVLTGFDNLDLGLTALRFGADDYLMKNHVDSYTLERAIKYAIERRRLMLGLVRAEVENLEGQEASAAAASVSILNANQAGDRLPSRVAVGTHEVNVRVDQDSHEYELMCTSCNWKADRGSDTLHSWSARSLDLTLLNHINGRAQPTTPTPTPGKPRRDLFHARGWLELE